jgi:hypothetical protein
VDELARSFDKCPKGHKLPHTVEGNGSCSPIRCARDGQGFQEMKEAQQAVEEAETERADPDRKEALAEAKVARVQMQRSIAREIARRRLVSMPEGLSGGDAEAYVERKLVELSVDAVAELEYQLKYLDDDKRATAAARILESTGHGKRERAGQFANLIIVQGMVPGQPLPWSRAPIGALPSNGEKGSK